MLKNLLIALSFLTASAAMSQALVYNNGADVYVKDGGFMIVKTNSVQNAAGLLDNQGTVVVEGYVQNDATISGLGDTIRLTGDWINNSSYAGAGSWVEMNGGAQLLTGAQSTTFNNLALLGGNVVKTQTINQEVTGTLNLANAELATDAFEMLVSNNVPAAIQRNAGFVSSLGLGRLSRATNSTSAYLFPTGSPSSLGTTLYRPIEFRPSNATANVYGVRTIKGDATLDGYDVSIFDDSLCKVNPNFYHHLHHTTGTSAANVTMFYSASTDGGWNAQGNWRSNALWNYTGAATLGSGQGFSTVTVPDYNDFNDVQFALANKSFTIDAGTDLQLVEGETGQFTPIITNVVSPTFDWSPTTFLDCADCPSPEVTPTETTIYTLLITDAAGCSASDTVRAVVMPDRLLLPTAFSPNGDGVNDKFRPANKNLKKFNMQIFNRWGELVFETDNAKEGWDGVIKDREQQLGVFVWKVEYQTSNMKKNRYESGNVTLVR